MLSFRFYMKSGLLLFLVLYSGLHLSAQEPNLPHFPAKGEEALMQEYLDHKTSSRLIPSPPPAAVRTMAEWEQIQALIITWAGQSTILKEIVRYAVKECKVLIITTNPDNVSNQLTSAGISLDSVRFVETSFNSIWVRDYGPWSVYKNDVDSLYLIDWIYNRPRLQDDATPVAIAEFLDLPIYEATADPDDWVHTGGNHLPDGMGTAFSSMLVLEENNDKTEDEIDSIAKKYLGVHQYIKFPTLPFDGIHHLDMHMRIIDEETILFGEYPQGIADGPQINENIEYLLTDFKTSFGNKFKIVRIPMPPDGSGEFPDTGGDYRTYTNSIFINKTILVPIYEERYDTTALRIYREHLPGYNVVGINCNSIIPSLGALHCITKLVGVNDPLLIAHARLRDTENFETDYRVSAIIKHVSGIQEATIFYKTAKDSVYSSALMIQEDTILHQWSGHIPAFTPGTEVHYYIHAVANNGKSQVRPIVAPEGYFKFRIMGEPVNLPPVVSISSPFDGSVFNTGDENILIEVTADDPDGNVTQVILFINGDSITTIHNEPFSFQWIIPAEGNYEISAHAMDDDSLISISETVNITVEGTTSPDQIANSSLYVFPNPVLESLWLQQDGNSISDVSVYNAIGQRMPVTFQRQGYLIEMDFRDLQAGVYSLKYRVDEAWLIHKVIKI